MSDLIAAPFGRGLPYAALFAVPKHAPSSKRRPSNYYWNKAVAPLDPVVTATSPEYEQWLEEHSSVPSDTEHAALPLTSKPKRHFLKFRQLAFRAFVPKPGSQKPSTLITTELVSEQTLPPRDPHLSHSSHRTLFKSWRIKSRGLKTDVRQLVTLVRERISSKSDEEKKPKTWDEFHQLYAAGQLELNDPPLPPTQPSGDAENPTPYETKFYSPHRAADEPIRQLVINRLGVFGKTGFDSSASAAAQAKARDTLAEALEREGRAPVRVEEGWQPVSPSLDPQDPTFAVELTPETLEQHPVFRRIVKQCRELFGTALSMISIMEEDRQIFLAESGVPDMREAPRDFTICTHTVLSGRKGFTILDTQKDWRFENAPLVKQVGARFYAGVPLMSPALDGGVSSETGSVPIGTLCVVDYQPRESFGPEERQKLVYMAEYARREIEKWFIKKISKKVERLESCRLDSLRQLSHQLESDEEALDSRPPQPDDQAVPAPSFHRGLRLSTRLLSRSSLTDTSASTPPTSPSSRSFTLSPNLKPPGLFDSEGAGLKAKMQTVFDLATKLVAQTLDLSLVYLLAVAPSGDSMDLGRTLLLSAHDLPLPVPIFDASLHLRALRAAEGGLLYQNPSILESQAAALASGSDQVPYASALLAKVGPRELSIDHGGFVLAGYTTDPRRVFGAEDVRYMKEFANELSKYTIRLRL